MKKNLSFVRKLAKDSLDSFWSALKEEIKKALKSFFTVRNLLIQLADVAFVASFMLTCIGILDMQTFVAILVVYAVLFLLTRIVKVKNMFSNEMKKLTEGDCKNGNKKKRNGR